MSIPVGTRVELHPAPELLRAAGMFRGVVVRYATLAEFAATHAGFARDPERFRAEIPALADEALPFAVVRFDPCRGWHAPVELPVRPECLRAVGPHPGPCAN